MKRFILMCMMTIAAFTCFGQDAAQATGEVAVKTSFLSQIDWGSVLNIGLGVLAVVFVGAFAFVKNKLRQAGTLLIAFADAIEDKKIDANERVDLAQKAKALIGKS
jgi:hypothetical protein